MKIIFGFILLLYLPILAAAELILAPVTENTIKVGDSFNAVIRTSEKISLEQLDLALANNEKDLGPFYVAKISFLKNEASETLIGVGLVYREPIKDELLNFKLSQDSIFQIQLLKREQFDLTPLTPEAKYFVKTVEAKPDRLWLYLLILGVVLVLFVGWAIYRQRNSAQRKLIKHKKNRYEFWRKQLEVATKREDFEKIYQNRREWIEYATTKNKAKVFFRVLNQHQYKKEWNDTITSEVKEKLNQIQLQMVHK